MNRYILQRPHAASLAAALCLVLSGATQAQDKAEVAPSQIIGNRELPKVLVIVPWKKPLVEPTVGKPPVSVLDEALAPIDRDVFRRQQAYLSPAAPAGPSVPTPAPSTAPSTAPVKP